jgi:hypothetical protein
LVLQACVVQEVVLSSMHGRATCLCIVVRLG